MFLNRARLAMLVDASCERLRRADRKSTRLNSSHLVISYADFCLKKNKVAGLTTRQLAGTLAKDIMAAVTLGGADPAGNAPLFAAFANTRTASPGRAVALPSDKKS